MTGLGGHSMPRTPRSGRDSFVHRRFVSTFPARRDQLSSFGILDDKEVSLLLTTAKEARS